MICQYSR